MRFEKARGGLAGEFLEHVASILEVYKVDVIQPKLDPRCAVVGFYSLALATSFSSSLPASLFSYMLFVIVSPIYCKQYLRVFHVSLVVMAFTALIALPMALFQQTIAAQPTTASWHAERLVSELLPLILRASAASGFLALTVCTVGFIGMLKGLVSLGLPRQLVFMIATLLNYIPIAIRDLTKVLIAREARAYCRGGSRKELWLRLASAVGEAIIRGYNRAWKLQLTLAARGLDARAVSPITERATKRDVLSALMLIALSIVIAIMSVISA